MSTHQLGRVGLAAAILTLVPAPVAQATATTAATTPASSAGP